MKLLRVEEKVCEAHLVIDQRDQRLAGHTILAARREKRIENLAAACIGSQICSKAYDLETMSRAPVAGLERFHGLLCGLEPELQVVVLSTFVPASTGLGSRSILLWFFASLEHDFVHADVASGRHEGSNHVLEEGRVHRGREHSSHKRGLGARHVSQGKELGQASFTHRDAARGLLALRELEDSVDRVHSSRSLFKDVSRVLVELNGLGKEGLLACYRWGATCAS